MILRHIVKNTPDTIPPTEELESLRAKLVKLHLHSLERDVPIEGEGESQGSRESEREVAVCAKRDHRVYSN